MTSTNLPKGWVYTKLGCIANFKNGINFIKNQKQEDGILTIDVLNMYSKNIFIPLKNLYRVNKKINNDYFLKYGDILFVRSSVKREGVGWASAFREINEPVTFCGFIIRCRLKCEEIIPEFVTYFLRKKTTRELIINKSSQVTITNISQSSLKEILIPLPPLNEQKRIVEKIEELYSILDAGIAAMERVLEKIKNYRRIVLKHAFAGKLTEKWREKNKDQLELDYSSIVNKIPKGWILGRLGDFSSLITKGESPKWQGFNYVDEGILFIRSENVLWGKLNISNALKIPLEFHSKLKRSQVKANDVLINLVGASIGRCCVAPLNISELNINQAVALIRTKNEVYQTYLMYFLISPESQKKIQEGKVETARANISLTDLKSFIIPIPKIKEQKKIVEEIESRFEKADRVEQVVKGCLKKAGAIRQSILKKAFSGQLVPQDPSDEPAEKLLKKIQPR
ncbi:MAG: restriction endonuclease subunit S [Candidatus Aminicenantes bacterium]|nr:MAG: restriction endonuclease subunit S [Candidatus Aminicenantes bacterium]